MKRTVRLPIAGLAAVGIGVVFVASDARAQPRSSGSETITVKSWYGSKSITAPIRNGQQGREVRLPGGTWISCEADCKTTLREQSIDFWETLERRFGGSTRD